LPVERVKFYGIYTPLDKRIKVIIGLDESDMQISLTMEPGLDYLEIECPAFSNQ
jgi:hypothetical protein